MKVAIFDDDKYVLEELKCMVQRMPMVTEVRAYSDYGVAEAVLREPDFDVALMDIQWEKSRTGITLAEHLYHAEPRVKVVYVTGFSEQFIEHVFLADANIRGYLRKPVEQSLMEKLFRKLQEELAEEENDYILVKRYGTLIRVPTSDIMYLESSGHSTIIHTVKGEEQIYMSLSVLEKELPAGFARCQRSYLVNFKKVQILDKTSVVMQNGDRLSIGRGYTERFKNEWLEYMGKHLD